MHCVMAEKNASTETQESKQKTYTFEDAMTVADDIFSLQKDKEYHPGAFVHGLIFALEATQQSYQIPPQQLAEVKRSVRKYIKQVNETVNKEKS